MTAKKTTLLLASLFVLLFLSTAVTCWVVFTYQRGETEPGQPISANPREPASAQPAFADLRDTDLPGRYKWTEPQSENFIVLYDDYTFMNKDGTIFPQYRWEITPEGLFFIFQRDTFHFTNIEAAGVYTGSKSSGAPLRLEKLPSYTPAQRAVPAPIASIRFGAQCETNGLTPVNTGGDGEILPGDVAGEACHRLVRKPGRNAAYLYLQIDPALKDPAFTNALVLVEYLDRASTTGNPGTLVIHYDDDNGAYANSQPLRLAANDAWQEATFYLATPVFENRQNSGGDFRLVTSRSELPIRSVKLVKNAPLPEAKMPAVSPR